MNFIHYIHYFVFQYREGEYIKQKQLKIMSNMDFLKFRSVEWHWTCEWLSLQGGELSDSGRKASRCDGGGVGSDWKIH